MDEHYIYLPFWNREDRWGQDPRTFWDTQVLQNSGTVARKMQERFALPGQPSFGVMDLDWMGLDTRYALGAVYPRPERGCSLVLPDLRKHGLNVERLPPLKYEGDWHGVDYTYKLIGRVQDFLLYFGLRDQKDQVVLFRVVRNGTPFARFQEMARRLSMCLETMARAATGGYDPSKAWGVFWPETEFEHYLPPYLSESTLT